MRHREGHRTERIGWLRAAVLGANDGIVSTASLVVGVAAGGALRHDVLLAGAVGVVAGALAQTVAQQLMAHDAVGAHARDELGLSDKLAARPLQAALSSAATFTAGAIVPILAAILPSQNLGCSCGWGASAWIGAARVAFWGVLALAATAGVGALFGTKVA